MLSALQIIHNKNTFKVFNCQSNQLLCSNLLDMLSMAGRMQFAFKYLVKKIRMNLLKISRYVITNLKQ